MLFNIWRFIQLLLPYGLILHMYKNNKAIPANIKTKSGKILKAIMITEKYGLLFTSGDYISNRGKILKERQNQINLANKQLADEINSLSFVAREELFGKEE